mgnify:FL=1
MGIDPGLDGGIALIDGEGKVVLLSVMPTLLTGKGGKRTLNIVALRKILLGNVEFVGDFEPADLICLERQQPYPSQGGVSNFTTGLGYGILLALIEGVWPLEIVGPKAWQKFYGIAGGEGQDVKAQALLVGRGLYPNIDFRATPRCKKAHSGLVDALLIARYGLSRHPAAQVEAKLAAAGPLKEAEE